MPIQLNSSLGWASNTPKKMWMWVNGSLREVKKMWICRTGQPYLIYSKDLYAGAGIKILSTDLSVPASGATQIENVRCQYTDEYERIDTFTTTIYLNGDQAIPSRGTEAGEERTLTRSAHVIYLDLNGDHSQYVEVQIKQEANIKRLKYYNLPTVEFTVTLMNYDGSTTSSDYISKKSVSQTARYSFSSNEEDDLAVEGLSLSDVIIDSYSPSTLTPVSTGKVHDVVVTYHVNGISNLETVHITQNGEVVHTFTISASKTSGIAAKGESITISGLYDNASTTNFTIDNGSNYSVNGKNVTINSRGTDYDLNPRDIVISATYNDGSKPTNTVTVSQNKNDRSITSYGNPTVTITSTGVNIPQGGDTLSTTYINISKSQTATYTYDSTSTLTIAAPSTTITGLTYHPASVDPRTVQGEGSINNVYITGSINSKSFESNKITLKQTGLSKQYSDATISNVSVSIDAAGGTLSKNNISCTFSLTNNGTGEVLRTPKDKKIYEGSVSIDPNKSTNSYSSVRTVTVQILNYNGDWETFTNVSVSQGANYTYDSESYGYDVEVAGNIGCSSGSTTTAKLKKTTYIKKYWYYGNYAYSGKQYDSSSSDYVTITSASVTSGLSYFSISKSGTVATITAKTSTTSSGNSGTISLNGHSGSVYQNADPNYEVRYDGYVKIELIGTLSVISNNVKASSLVNHSAKYRTVTITSSGTSYGAYQDVTSPAQFTDYTFYTREHKTTGDSYILTISYKLPDNTTIKDSVTLTQPADEKINYESVTMSTQSLTFGPGSSTRSITVNKETYKYWKSGGISDKVSGTSSTSVITSGLSLQDNPNWISISGNVISCTAVGSTTGRNCTVKVYYGTKDLGSISITLDGEEVQLETVYDNPSFSLSQKETIPVGGCTDVSNYIRVIGLLLNGTVYEKNNGNKVHGTTTYSGSFSYNYNPSSISANTKSSNKSPKTVRVTITGGGNKSDYRDIDLTLTLYSAKITYSYYISPTPSNLQLTNITQKNVYIKFKRHEDGDSGEWVRCDGESALDVWISNKSSNNVRIVTDLDANTGVIIYREGTAAESATVVINYGASTNAILSISWADTTPALDVPSFGLSTSTSGWYITTVSTGGMAGTIPLYNIVLFRYPAIFIDKSYSYSGNLKYYQNTGSPSGGITKKDFDENISGSISTSNKVTINGTLYSGVILLSNRAIPGCAITSNTIRVS